MDRVIKTELEIIRRQLRAIQDQLNRLAEQGLNQSPKPNFKATDKYQTYNATDEIMKLTRKYK